MSFTDQFIMPGDHALLLPGCVGALEAVLSVPVQTNPHFMAIIGHPHSLQGGTMNNKVVTTLARVFKDLHIPSLRFNFRGVGQSEGCYDQGIGESDDMLLLAQQWQKARPEVRFIFAGFSFGSYVAYRTAAHFDQTMLITVAPPVHHYDYHEARSNVSSWLVLQGDADEVVPYSLVEEWVPHARPVPSLITFADTGHFFHGKLLELKAQLLDYLQPKVSVL